MTAPTVPTFAEFVSLLTSEQQRLLDAMDCAIARKDHAEYAAQHALFLELGAAFDALWQHKEAERKAAQCLTSAALALADPTEDDMDGLVRMDARRQMVALDASIELESLARLLPRLVSSDGDNSHEAHYAVRGVAGRVLRLSSVLMSALSDESETTAHLERVLNLDCGQG